MHGSAIPSSPALATLVGRARRLLSPRAAAFLASAGCLFLLALTRVVGSLFPQAEASPVLYLVGGAAVLAVPALVAWNRRTLAPLGPEVLPAFAFYLSMYHAPVRRLLGESRTLRPVEVSVLQMALYASVGLSLTVCLRPGAFDARSYRRAPVPNLALHEARMQAYGGLAAALVGYALLAFWIGSVGVERLASASLGDVYLYGSGLAVVTFQWPFIVGGLVMVARTFGRWPEARLPRGAFVLFAALVAGYVAINARLGVRGPSLELFGAIYLVREDTLRPVARRAVVSFGVLFAVFFFTVSAMRGHLDAGFVGTSVDEIGRQAREGASGETSTEFDAIFDNHVMIVELAGVKLPYLDGESWTDIPLQLIPRQIVGNKPLGLSAWWIRVTDPEAAAQGAGRAFGSFAEGYLNFGVVGAMAQVMAVTAFLLFAFPLLGSGSNAVAAAAAVMLAHSYHCHRSEFISLAFFARNAALVAVASLALRWLFAVFLKPIRGAK